MLVWTVNSKKECHPSISREGGCMGVCSEWELSSCYLFMHALIYKGLIQLEELYHFLLNYFMLLHSFALVRLNFTLINLACSHNDSWPLTSGSMRNHVYRACIFH